MIRQFSRATALALLASATLMQTAPAGAATIAAGSLLSITGANSYNDGTGTITFLSANPLTTLNETGSFTELGAGGVPDLEHLGAPIQYNNLTSGSNLMCGSGCIYTVTGNNNNTATFDLTSEVVTFDLATGSLSIKGTGTATLTGFDATAGTFFFSTQGPANANVTFSATTAIAATPLPGTLPLFAGGLLGLLAWRRKRSQVNALRGNE